MAREANVYSSEGQSVVTLTHVGKEGNQLVMRGKLMGAWDSTMYVHPEDVVGTLRLLVTPQVIWYMICLPFYLIGRRGK